MNVSIPSFVGYFGTLQISRTSDKLYPLVACNGMRSSGDSFFREPIPGEEVALPNPSAPTGEYLLDRDLIEKVASLRKFIEDIEIKRGKVSKLRQIEGFIAENERINVDYHTSSKPQHINTDDKEPKIAEITKGDLEPIRDLICEENLLEEVLSAAFEVYRKKNDFDSIERLEEIAYTIIPMASTIRKKSAEENIVRIIRCYMFGEEDLDAVLEELRKAKALNKYLMHRLDEFIKISSKKYRISEKHPAISERLLRIIKDRISAEQITNFRGTDLFVQTLSQCFERDDCSGYEEILRDKLRKIEDLEGFYEWINDGIDFCREKNRMTDKIGKMESIASIAVRLHPIWTPVDDHIETEDGPCGGVLKVEMKKDNI